MAYSQPQLVELITEARSAYHDLQLGRAARVVVDQNGEKVEFVPATKQALYLYIQDLERQLASLTSTPVVRGPAGFVF